MIGYVKLHRSLMEWEWYKTPNMTHFFNHCLMRANHKESKWQGQTVKPGQFISGRKQLSKETGLSERQIRTCINRLKTTSNLTTKSTNKNTLYTVVNWESYQVEEKKRPTKRPANGPTSDQQATTNKNDKNEKEIKNIIPPKIEWCFEYAKSQNLTIDVEDFFDYWESAGWKRKSGIVKDWQATMRNKARRNKQDNVIPMSFGEDDGCFTEEEARRAGLL